ncbi:MAG: SPASM domain-containing protein [Gammaproteobacteria bacterium]|nr:SPASM domain-containing protein [Gammaproteobacteria bacterium]
MKAEVKSKLNLEQRVALQDVIPLESPFLLYVDPSSACNFRCQFCPTGHKDLVKNSDYRRSAMNYGLFEKLVDNLSAFSQPLKVMRMNKIGEPLLNKKLVDMITLAKDSGRVEHIDLATNGALFSPDLLTRLVTAGLDRLNISLEGINSEQYQKHAKVDIDFPKFIDTIKWLYSNKGDCEVTIKVPGNYLTEDQKKQFFDTFGDYCDRIFVEEIAPIWPGFDVEQRTGLQVQSEQGQYKQSLQEKSVCTYIFYAMAINADGTVSACCPDWDQKLLIGDLREQSLTEIWTSDKMNALRLLHLENDRKANPVCRDCGHIKHAQVDNIDPYREQLLKKMNLERAS